MVENRNVGYRGAGYLPDIDPISARLGRAFAVSAAFNFAGYPIGSAIAGAVVGYALAPAVLFGVVMCLLGGFLAWYLIPQHEEPLRP